MDTRHPLERPNRITLMGDEPEVGMTCLSEFKFDGRLKSMLRESWGINELFPPQAAALPHSLDGRNLMLAIPTASGKSLVAHITMAHRLANDLSGMRGVYIVPLKALASEKYEELVEISASVGLKVGMAIGDRSSETLSLIHI